MQPFPNVTIYSPPSFETWDYSNPDTQGIGGSETCHIELAKRFAQRGYNVISYGPTPYTTPKTEHNVVWDNYKNIDYTREGIWILIRDCSIVDNIPPLNNRIWLICQDEDYSKENAPTWNWVWNEERRNKLEKIIALCPSHLENLQYAYPDSQEKIVLGSNGIKMDLIREVEKENIQRNKNKIIYFSSPLRGLIPTLKIFKKVREYFPETELTIAYGWDNVNKILDEFPIAKVKKQQIEVLLNQPNITFTGRLPQKALYKEIASSSLFLYPTNFCVEGDTLIDMPRDYQKYPNGVPIKDLVGKSQFPIWCYNEEKGQFQLSPVKWVAKTREKATVWKIEFEEGGYLRATPDHKILLKKTGEWVKLKDLKVGDSLLHLGKHMMIQVGIGNGGRKTPWPHEHRIIGEYIAGRKLSPNEHVDHKDGNCWNNEPDNLQILTQVEHAKKTFSGKTRTKKSNENSIIGWRKYYATVPQEVKSERNRAASQSFWNNLSSEDRKSFVDTRAEKIRLARAKSLLQQYPNHRVKDIYFDGYEDVYDLEVDGPHNFVANGIVVHNCETSCISCMEAQALGAIPIVSNLGALTNNVQFGEIIDGDIREGLVLGRFVKGIIEWLSQEPLQDILRPPMRTYAQYVFNWERIIDKYESWIHNYGDGHTIIAHSIFQLAHSRGNILNIGCNIDAAGFSNLGATNVDVREYDPVLKRANKVDVLADARNLPSSLFAQFDTTILGEILEHFTEERDVLKTLEEAKKTLKPSGRIIITVPEDYRDPEVQHHKHVKGEDYAKDSKSYHWRPVTKELLYSWLEKTSLKVEHYRQLDYDYFLGHGVVVGK